jgi:hypothetical protein
MGLASSFLWLFMQLAALGRFLVQEDTGIWSLESEDNEGEGGEEDLDLFA